MHEVGVAGRQHELRDQDSGLWRVGSQCARAENRPVSTGRRVKAVHLGGDISQCMTSFWLSHSEVRLCQQLSRYGRIPRKP